MEDYNENMNNNYNFNQPNGEPHSDPYNQFYTTSEENKPIWAALASFIISICNVIFCCCCSYISIIASLAFGIVSLANKWRGKGFAIAGVVISSVTLVVLLISQIFLGELSTGLTNMMVQTPEYYEEYSETGEIPDELVKYNDDKYDWYWSIMGYDGFDEFFDYYMKLYGSLISEAEEEYDSSNTPIEDEDFFDYDYFYGDEEMPEPEFGETPVEL